MINSLRENNMSYPRQIPCQRSKQHIASTCIRLPENNNIIVHPSIAAPSGCSFCSYNLTRGFEASNKGNKVVETCFRVVVESMLRVPDLGFAPSSVWIPLQVPQPHQPPYRLSLFCPQTRVATSPLGHPLGWGPAL